MELRLCFLAFILIPSLFLSTGARSPELGGIPSDAELSSLLQKIETMRYDGEKSRELANTWKSFPNKISKIQSILHSDPKYIEAEKLLNESKSAHNECREIFDQGSVFAIHAIFDKVKSRLNKDIQKFLGALDIYLKELDDSKKYIENYLDNRSIMSSTHEKEILSKHVETAKMFKSDRMREELQKIVERDFSVEESSTKIIGERILTPISRCVSFTR